MNGIFEENKIKAFVKLVKIGWHPLVAYKMCGLDLSFEDLMNELKYQMSLMPQQHEVSTIK